MVKSRSGILSSMVPVPLPKRHCSTSYYDDLDGLIYKMLMGYLTLQDRLCCIQFVCKRWRHDVRLCPSALQIGTIDHLPIALRCLYTNAIISIEATNIGLSVDDVKHIETTCGKTLQDLDISGNTNLTDGVVEILYAKNAFPTLRSLRLAYLRHVTFAPILPQMSADLSDCKIEVVKPNLNFIDLSGTHINWFAVKRLLISNTEATVRIHNTPALYECGVDCGILTGQLQDLSITGFSQLLASASDFNFHRSDKRDPEENSSSTTNLVTRIARTMVYHKICPTVGSISAEWIANTVFSQPEVNLLPTFLHSVVLQSGQEGMESLSKVIVQGRADVMQPMRYGETPLMLAAQDGETQKMVIILDAARLQIQDSLACRLKSNLFGRPLALDTRVVNARISAYVNATTNGGRTALWWAAGGVGHVDAVIWLLINGADPNIRPVSRLSIPHLPIADEEANAAPNMDPDANVRSNRNNPDDARADDPPEYVVGGNFSPLISATLSDSNMVVQHLLLAKADVNDTASGWSALACCADNGNVEAVDMICRAGADIEYSVPPEPYREVFNSFEDVPPDRQGTAEDFAVILSGIPHEMVAYDLLEYLAALASIPCCSSSTAEV